MISTTSATRKDGVYFLLRERIQHGEFAPGTPLSETALAELFQVSRTPVREALQRLSAEGVVTFYSNRGAFVKVLSPQDVTEIFEVREALEGFAARKAAGRLTDLHRKQLRELIERVRGRSRMTAESVRQEWEKLRQLILEVAENERIRRVLSAIQVQVDIARRYSTSPPGRVEEIRAELLQLAGAVLAGKGREAENIVRSHLRRSKGVVLKVVSFVPGKR